MKLIHNFTSNKHIPDIPVFDIIIWIVALHNAHALGYTTKLYCTPNNLDWLKQWNLLQLYDEIDTETLDNPNNYPNVNQEKFWSIRKLICIDHEFKIATEPFVFSDTDVILFEPINLIGKDLIVWSPDPYGPSAPIYCKWQCLSAPPKYEYPQWLLSTEHAYNAGILYFRTNEIWQLFYQQYLTWTVDNPCRFTIPFEADCEATVRNVWACNAEQRLLAAVADHCKWSVGMILPEVQGGSGQGGIHYFILRAMLRRLREEEFEKKMSPKDIKYWRNLYKEHLVTWFRLLEPYEQAPFADIEWLQAAVQNNLDPLPY